MSDSSFLPTYDPNSGTQDPLRLLQVYLSERIQSNNQMDLDDNVEPSSSSLGNLNTTTSTHNNNKNKESSSLLPDIFRVGDFLFGTTFEGAIAILDAAESLITRVISAPSQRTAFLVTSSSGKQVATYLCLLPQSSKEGNQIATTTSCTYYCSCRSFLEKNARSLHFQLCKHLLAITILPHVGVQCKTIETLTDQEFGRVLVSRGTPTG